MDLAGSRCFGVLWLNGERFNWDWHCSSRFFPPIAASPGVYVQDLWVSGEARGQGLGRRLLAEVINYSSQQWDASYLTLTVYADNINATKFYRSLGFTTDKSDLPMALDGDAFVQVGNGTNKLLIV